MSMFPIFFISKRPMLVEMKMGARSNSAILTSGWDMVVRKFNLMEDDKILFFFSERDDGDLDLVVCPSKSVRGLTSIVCITAVYMYGFANVDL
jgi:hypothetical protein